jgi:hypothetical protein
LGGVTFVQVFPAFVVNSMPWPPPEVATSLAVKTHSVLGPNATTRLMLCPLSTTGVAAFEDPVGAPRFGFDVPIRGDLAG